MPSHRRPTAKAAVRQRPPPETVDAKVESFLGRVALEMERLSRQLKVIARYIEQHRDQIALQRIQDVAEQCAVQPSAVVRFAKHFGFSGYSEMQRLFREGAARRLSGSGTYQARIREVIERGSGTLTSAELADAFIGGAVAGLQSLRDDFPARALDDAVELLAHAPCIWIVGARRAFAVASYLAYAMQHTAKPVQFSTAVGAMQEGQLRGMRPDDVMIVISFAPYAAETAAAAELARTSGVKLIALSDSRMSPVSVKADVALLVNESMTFGFRALTNSMALAQVLFVALAYRLELDVLPLTSSRT